MSKTQLNKELMNMSKDQLLELVLEMYSARKEIKEYLEFYLNPDSKKLYEKYIALIEREFKRVKWRNNRARISKIRAAIKEFESFSPDPDYRNLIYQQTLAYAINYETRTDFPPTLFKGVMGILTTWLQYSDACLALDRTLKTLQEILDRKVGTRYMRDQISTTIDTYLQNSK